MEDYVGNNTFPASLFLDGPHTSTIKGGARVKPEKPEFIGILW